MVEKARAKGNCSHCRGRRSWYEEKGKVHIYACQMRGKASFSTGEASKILGVFRSHVAHLVDKCILPGVQNPFTNIREISKEGIIKMIKDAKVIFHDDSGAAFLLAGIGTHPIKFFGRWSFDF